jgi:hypothetical protein
MSIKQNGKHTPTPWRIMPENQAQSAWIIADAEGGSIADCEPPGPWMTVDEADANAALIVRAVNAYDALLAALKVARQWMPDKPISPSSLAATDIATIDAAIALAETGRT